MFYIFKLNKVGKALYISRLKKYYWVVGDKMKGKEIFISYMNDNGEKVESFVVVVDITPSYVSFKTKGSNELLIPMHRVLKMKLKGDASE